MEQIQKLKQQIENIKNDKADSIEFPIFCSNPSETDFFKITTKGKSVCVNIKDTQISVHNYSIVTTCEFDSVLDGTYTECNEKEFNEQFNFVLNKINNW